MSAAEIVIHRVAGGAGNATATPVDPVTTEIVRHALDAAAMQMRQVLVRSIDLGKTTGMPISAGTVIEVQTPSGGGWGPPSQRDPERVREELRDGCITESFAREHYPHALDVSE